MHVIYTYIHIHIIHIYIYIDVLYIYIYISKCTRVNKSNICLHASSLSGVAYNFCKSKSYRANTQQIVILFLHVQHTNQFQQLFHCCHRHSFVFKHPLVLTQLYTRSSGWTHKWWSCKFLECSSRIASFMSSHG